MTTSKRNERYPAEQEHRLHFSWRFLLPQYWLVWLGVGLIALLQYLPWRMRERLARWLGRRFARHEKRRRIVDLNLAWCFPDRSEPERIAMRQAFFVHAARAVLDYGLLWFASHRRLARRVALADAHYLNEAVAAGKRVILLTCHTLALEYGALQISREHPVVGLIKSARNPIFEYLVTRGRTRFKTRLFRRDAGIRNIVRAIRAGYIFYYLPDEDLGETKQTTFLPYFGVQTATLTALGRMARTCEAVVIPCFTYFDEGAGRYVARFFPPLPDFPSGDDVADARRMNEELERMIRLAPEQYMWSFRMFQTRPPGEANPYHS